MTEAAKIEYVSSVTLKLVGKPGDLLNSKTMGERKLMGRIFGTAHGIASKIGLDGEPSEYLKGDFAITDVDGNEYRSGKCYLPGALIDSFVSKFDETDDKNTRLTFGFDVFAVRAENKAGFTWRFESLVDLDAKTDPMTILRNQLEQQSKRNHKALPKPNEKDKAA